MPEIASSAVSASPETLVRGRLLWLVAAPAGAAALLFAVTAGYLWAGGADASDVVLIGVFLAAVVALTVAAGQAVAAIRRIDDRLAPVRAEAAAARAQTAAARADLADARREVADARAETTAALTEAAGYRAAVTDARADIDRLTEQLRAAAERPVPVRTSAGRQVEVFVNLSRRLQSLVHREIKLLDALENEVEDPDLLKGLFQVDHLATRIRRHAENLAVLGGAVSRRQWSRPVALTEVLRSAIAEVEHYSRVKLVPPIDGTVPGHAVASIIHLVAELIENATMFAPPQTQVLLRAQHVTAGVAVEVEDRGLGLQREDQERVNRLLLNPEDINLDELLRDGRIGLFVVSMIARQHGVTVQLQGNIYGGTQAVIILPQHLLGSAQDGPEPPAVHRTQATLADVEVPAMAGAPAGPAGRTALTSVPVSAGPATALSQSTIELAQRVPGPSQIASAPPSWPAFTSVTAAHAVVPGAADTAPAATRATPDFAESSAPVQAQVREPVTAEPLHRGAFEPPRRTGAEAAEGRPAGTPPPLPRRHSQTHLAPQLQFGPPQAAPENDGETNPRLMASFMQGVSRSDAAAPAAAPVDAEPATSARPEPAETARRQQP